MCIFSGRIFVCSCQNSLTKIHVFAYPGGATLDYDNDPAQRRAKAVRANVQDDQSGPAGDGVRKIGVSASTLQKVRITAIFTFTNPIK